MEVALPVGIIGRNGEPTASLASDLRRLGYEPHVISWPAPALRWSGPRPVAVLLDFRSLGVDATRACRAAKEASGLREVAAIGLIPEQEASRIDFSLGFDDLILTPYRLPELEARLRLLRWRREVTSSPDVLRVGQLTLNPATYDVTVARRPVQLTLKEYQLLLFLLRNPGRVFTREELLFHVWADDYYGGTRTVDVHIRRLRAKAERAGDLIETVRGVGYRLVPPDWRDEQ